MKYRIEIGGRGGEVVIGSVKREFYDIVEEHEIDVEDYAWNDDFFEETETEIPEDIRPFHPGEWHECDDLAHHTGPSLEDCYITVMDENDTVIYDALTADAFFDMGADTEQTEEIYPQETLEDGDVYFLGQSIEKGHFLSFECEDEAFDPKKLVFTTGDYDGWELVTGVNYNGESLDDLGDSSTDGKGSEFQLILVEKDY
jgi:hypothetical protein